MNLTLFLADDHRIVRQGLRAILSTEAGIEIVGEAADGATTLRLVERLQPAVLLLDLMMPGLNGLDVARQLAGQASRTRIVVLSMHSNEAYVGEAMRAGALGYVLKDAGAAEMVKAIRRAAAGERYLSPPISEQAIDQYLLNTPKGSLEPSQSLTQREREVLQLSVDGHSSSEIAKRLFLSPRTVESHRMSMMRKIGVRNLKELIRYAIEKEMVLKKPRL